MAEEIFDICDEQDRVIGQAPRSEVHAQGLLHRAVHIWVIRSNGELLVQIRTATKDQYPNCITSAASGHVDAGEDYDVAAKRELWEELQLRGPLERIVKLPAGPETALEHSMLYVLRTDETPVPDPHEIAELRTLGTPELARMIEETPELFTPPFRSLLKWWIQNRATP